MKKSVRGRTLRRLALVCTLAIAASAHGQSREFDVAAGDLKAALDTYIAQAGVQLLYKVDDIKGLSTKGLKGALSPEEALTRLLEGTRLKVRRDASGAIVLYSAPPDEPKPRADVSTLDTVMVSASRRREPVREVPLKVDVLQTEALERGGARELRDYVADQPGVTLSRGGAFSGALSIRGLATASVGASSVGVYIDDVATGSSAPYGMGATTPLDMGLLDLKHIEILRGPQGTLYGAGSMGGLIKYVTNEPDTGEFSGSVRLAASSTRYGGMGHTVNGVVNVPIKMDVAAVRVAAYRTRFGGYDDAIGLAAEKNVNRSVATGARISTLLTPSRNLSMRLTATTQEEERSGNDYEDFSPATGQFPSGERRRLLNASEPSGSRTHLLGLDVEYDMGWARLNAITSVQDVTLRGKADGPSLLPLVRTADPGANAVWADSHGEQHRVSQEFRLTSRASRDIEWLAGLYINRERSKVEGGYRYSNASGPSSLNLYTTDKPAKYRDLAAYGDVTWHATPALALTAGVRVARMEQMYNSTVSGLLAGRPSSNGGESKENATTWLAAAGYKLSPDSSLYARIASGYRPGGPNALLPTTSPAVKPMFESDSLWSYEVGYKASLLDRRLTVEAAIYDIEWSDILQPITDGGFSYFTNAGKARISGTELSLSWLPSAAWRFGGALSLIDAKLRTDATGLGGHAGDDIPSTARITASLSATHNFELGGRAAYFGVNARHVGKRNAGFPGSPVLPAYMMPSYTVLGLQTGIDFERYKLSAYVRNLNNSRGIAALAFTSLTAAKAVVTEPRTIGVAVNVPF
ncbi:TonB-dependent receptor [Paucibacter sp. PLA-PC-4]|uniref:TonB-dependent receptor domain-containing protein n=1 Tax=Paucibacter sp. PLA-PC-4 TaxID=2993655 RepID=UPI00224AC71F|nr:TonB-dependent receptor [Paucibacter sp. PLA-PC-4]MCX2865479.1 TonB-dependent receptor [Paucibacter sp. PLA-PC-4]